MSITLTEAAARQVRTQLEKRGHGLGLRIGVRNVGCSGFAYTYEIADELHPGERVFDSHGSRVVVDGKALAFIDGARVDFASEGLKRAFKVDNPNAEGTCGCGESFNMKTGAA
jgi:iron-sulfur cluster assembly protein